jgi:type I restriction enzyme S subunit
MSRDWPVVKLDEVIKQDTNYVYELVPKMYPKLSVKLYGRGVVLDSPTDGATVRMKRHQLAKPGQVILSEIWAKKGAIGIVPKEGKGALITSHFFLFDICEEKLFPDYMAWLLKGNYFAGYLWSEARGTTGYAAIRPKQFLALEIPLPSTAEQRRIVNRIDELAAKVEQAQKLQWQSVAAVEALLPNIFSLGYDEAATIAGGTERLDDLCYRVTDGTHSTPVYVEDGIPFLSVKDITSGTIRFDDVKYITPEEHAYLTKRCKPEFNDVLLTKVGTTGFAKAIDVDREFSIFVSLALLKIDREKLDSKFTEYMLNSSRLKEYSEKGTRGVGNKNLVLKFIREFPMPAPPLSEQRRIVAYLDSLQAKVEAVKRHQAATAAKLDALLPSILDKAFKGEL